MLNNLNVKSNNFNEVQTKCEQTIFGTVLKKRVAFYRVTYQN